MTVVWGYLTQDAGPSRFLYPDMLAQFAAGMYLAFWPGQSTANAYGPPPRVDDASSDDDLRRRGALQ